MKKKELIIGITCLSIIGTGCSSTAVEQTSASASPSPSAASSSDPSQKDAIKIDEIDWKMEPAVIDGERGYAMQFTNNSQYTVTELEIDLTMKKDLSEDQTALFNKTIKIPYQWNDEYMSIMKFSAHDEKLAAPGDTITDVSCSIGNMKTGLMTEEIFEMFEPDMMSISYIGDDGKGYSSYYDFKNDVYGSSSRNKADIREWPAEKLAKLVPEPEFPLIKIHADEDDYFYATVRGMKLDDYTAYKQGIIDAGFINDKHEYGNSYGASNADGYYVGLSYYDTDESMNLTIKNKA